MRARRGVISVIVVLVVLGLLVVGYFVADAALRSFAEGEIKKQIVSNLPPEVETDPVVTIGGASFIGQYLAGSFEKVMVDDAKLQVGGVQLGAHLVAKNVPTDQTKPVGHTVGVLTLDQAGLDAIVRAAKVNAELTLAEGTVDYEGTVSFYGLNIDYLVSAKPVAKGQVIDLAPTALELKSGAVDVNAKSLLDLVAKTPIPICVAPYLPAGVSVTSVEVQPDRAVVQLEGSNIVLAELDLTQHDPCP